MKPRISIKTIRPAVLPIWIWGALLVPLLLAGCGSKKDEGIEAVFRVEFDNTNVGDSDSYPDGFLTPDEVRIGVRSVQLIAANETEPSYAVFETQDDTDPVLLDLTGTARSAGINPVFPAGCPCEFSKVRVALTFVDIRVPVYFDESAVNHRFRFYTLDLADPDLAAPVKAGEVLVGVATNAPQFNWIDIDDGDFVPLTEPRPAVPLQVPASRFPDDAYGSAVTIDLPSFLEIPDKPEGLITLTLTVHAGNLFFYDETDTEGAALTRFDRFTDGRLNAKDPNSHFYPTFPTLAAAAE
ncbi:MAG: hypothetical protein HY349_03130 [Nitrospirae bacterium]|nr:hypothetical protein [Nitrospirota bacterium]